MEGRAGDGGDNHPRWFPSTKTQAPFSQPPRNDPDGRTSSRQNHFTHRSPSMENNYSQNPDSQRQCQCSLDLRSRNCFSLNLPSQSHFPQTENQVHVPENHPQNLPFRCPFNQNPTPPRCFLQNPILQSQATQNQPSDILYAQYLYENSIANLVSNDLHGYGNTSLSRLNESAPSRLNQFPGNYSFSHSSPLSYWIQNQEIDDLESLFPELNIESPMRGYSSYGDQFNITDQGFSDLGRLRPNPTAFVNNHPYLTNAAPLTNQAAAVSNGYSSPYWSYPGTEPVHGSSSAGPNSNLINRTRLDLGSNSNQSINASVPPSSRFDNHDARLSMEQLKGQICWVAKDRQGCLFLQEKVDKRNPRDTEMILMEVNDQLHELMVHHFANYLIQKLFGVLNEEQMTKLIRSIVSSQHRLLRICQDLNGSRVMQILLDSSECPHRQPLTPVQKRVLVSALKKITVTLSKSAHGYHVILRCLQKFSSEYTQDIVEEIAKNCLNMAIDKSGCCLLQTCILLAKEEQKERLIVDIVVNSLFLSDHPFGNYVVQHILGLKIPQVTGNTIMQLAGNFYTLAQGKCSSNVVEKCLRESTEEQSDLIIKEIMEHPEVLELILHPFGNYVFQSAWMISQGRPIRHSLYHLIEINAPFLKSHIYGKRVLATIKGNKIRAHKRLPL